MKDDMEVIARIESINRIIKDFSHKIAHEHHKPRDTGWEIKFKPAWEKPFTVIHDGYWLNYISVESKDLLTALKIFKLELEKRVKKEIDIYDFKNHCGKEE